MCGALYRSNVGVDFVFPESTNLSAYRVILVPPLYVASDAVLAKLVDYVKGGGNLVLSFKSGFCNEYSTVRWEMAPGLCATRRVCTIRSFRHCSGRWR